MFRSLIGPLAFAAALASAESNTLTGRPGFFQPTPDGDSSISKIVPLPEPANASPDVAAATTTIRDPLQLAETPAAAARIAEADMDRAEREHRDMTERSVQSATTLQGAFTGLTGERDR